MKLRTLPLILIGLTCSLIGCDGDGMPADVEPVVPIATMESDADEEERLEARYGRD